MEPEDIAYLEKLREVTSNKWAMVDKTIYLELELLRWARSFRKHLEEFTVVVKTKEEIPAAREAQIKENRQSIEENLAMIRSMSYCLAHSSEITEAVDRGMEAMKAQEGAESFDDRMENALCEWAKMKLLFKQHNTFLEGQIETLTEINKLLEQHEEDLKNGSVWLTTSLLDS